MTVEKNGTIRRNLTPGNVREKAEFFDKTFRANPKSTLTKSSKHPQVVVSSLKPHSLALSLSSLPEAANPEIGPQARSLTLVPGNAAYPQGNHGDPLGGDGFEVLDEALFSPVAYDNPNGPNPESSSLLGSSASSVIGLNSPVVDGSNKSYSDPAGHLPLQRQGSGAVLGLSSSILSSVVISILASEVKEISKSKPPLFQSVPKFEKVKDERVWGLLHHRLSPSILQAELKDLGVGLTLDASKVLFKELKQQGFIDSKGKVKSCDSHTFELPVSSAGAFKDVRVSDHLKPILDRYFSPKPSTFIDKKQAKQDKAEQRASSQQRALEVHSGIYQPSILGADSANNVVPRVGSKVETALFPQLKVNLGHPDWTDFPDNLKALPKLLTAFWTLDLVNGEGKVKEAFSGDVNQVFEGLKLCSPKVETVIQGNMTKASFVMAYLCKEIYCPKMSVSEFIDIIKAGQNALYSDGPVTDKAMLGLQWCQHFGNDAMYERGGKRLFFGDSAEDRGRMMRLTQRIEEKSVVAWSSHTLGLGVSEDGLGYRHDYVGDFEGKSPFALESSLFVPAFMSGADRVEVKAVVRDISSSHYRALNNLDSQQIWCLANAKLKPEVLMLELKQRLTPQQCAKLKDETLPGDVKKMIAWIQGEFSSDTEFSSEFNRVVPIILDRYSPAGGQVQSDYSAVIKAAQYMGKEMHLFTKDEQYGQQDAKHEAIHNNPLRQTGPFKKLFKEEWTKKSPLRRMNPELRTALKDEVRKKPVAAKQKEHASELRSPVKVKTFVSEKVGITLRKANDIFQFLIEEGVLSPKAEKSSKRHVDIGLGLNLSTATVVPVVAKTMAAGLNAITGRHFGEYKDSDKFLVAPDLDIHLTTLSEFKVKYSGLVEKIARRFPESADAVVAHVFSKLQSKSSASERVFALVKKHLSDKAVVGRKKRFHVPTFKFGERAVFSAQSDRASGFYTKGDVESMPTVLKMLSFTFKQQIPSISDALTALEAFSYDPSKADQQIELAKAVKTQLQDVDPELSLDIQHYLEAIIELQRLQPGVNVLTHTYEGVERFMTATFIPPQSQVTEV